MKAISIVFLSVFVAVSIFHLCCCFFEKEKIRKISKPFCLLMLIIFALVTLPYPSGIPLIIALFGAELGDIFLIKKERRKNVIFGIIFFLLAHLGFSFYMLYLIYLNVHFSFFIIYSGIFLVLFLLAPFLLYKPLKPIAHSLSRIGSVYIIALLLLLSTSIVFTIFSGNRSFSICCIIGASLFIFSDSLLLFSMFIKDFKRRDFYIMLTYLLAVFSITFSLVIITG